MRSSKQAQRDSLTTDNTMNHSTAITTAMNPLAQLRLAWRKPLAALLGASAGLVPIGVFVLGHYELTSWSPLECPKAVIVYAGLVFSALTVLGWSSEMFGSRIKALGFTALLEGIMMSAHDGRLSAVALGYLIVINAVANGCRLAMRDHALTIHIVTSENASHELNLHLRHPCAMSVS